MILPGSNYLINNRLLMDTLKLDKWVQNVYETTDFNVCFHISDPTSLTSTPTDQTVKEGDETTLYCAAAGNPVPNITWIKDGKTVATGNELRFQANRNQSGKYWCSANNGLGLTVNASAYLNVQCKLEIIIFDVNKIYIWTETRSY